MIGVLIIVLYSMLIRDMDKGVLPYPGIAGRFCSDDPPLAIIDQIVSQFYV